MRKCTLYILNLLATLALLMCTVEISFSQNNKIDSLNRYFKTLNQKAITYPKSAIVKDTQLINTLNDLSIAYLDNNSDTSFFFVSKALNIALQLKIDKQLASSYFLLANVFRVKGDFPNALNYYTKALKIFERSADKTGISKAFGNIGTIYNAQGDYPKALDYLFKSLKLKEELGNKNLIAITLGNIGIVYNNQNDYVKALHYYSEAVKIYEDLGKKNQTATTLGNIGNVYGKQNDNEKALSYYSKAMEIFNATGNKNGIAKQLSNMGVVYQNMAESVTDNSLKQSNKTKALNYYLQSLEIAKKQGSKDAIAICEGNIGSLYMGIQKYDLAKNYLLDALKLNKETGAINQTMDVENYLSVFYEKTGQEKLALDYYKAATVLKDSIFNDDKEKEITRHELNFEFEKKEAALKAEQDKKEAVAETDKKRQAIFFWLVCLITIAVAVIALIVFRSLKLTRRQKRIIENQKILVEEKQKEIIDSIHYAKRIQRSLLPTEKYIEKSLHRLRIK